MPTVIELAQTLATGGAATAVIVVVRMFLAHLKEERDDRDRTRAQFLAVITNDLAHQTRAIADLARAVNELNLRLGRAAVIDRTVGIQNPEFRIHHAEGGPVTDGSWPLAQRTRADERRG